jgi:hypothetical protein
VPQLKIKIKGRGSMEIKVKYENVPNFCSSCGRMGHAAANCGQEAHDHEIIFGEDLRASPPKRTREIMIHQGPSRTVRPLFQKRDYGPRIIGSAGRRNSEGGGPGEGTATSSNWRSVHGEEAARDLATGVKDLHVKEDWESEDQLLQRKNRVSFGTNMTSEDESSGNDSCMQAENKLTTAAERFHARKFGSQNREFRQKTGTQSDEPG